MRMKFKKGITPETIAEEFVNHIREKGYIVGCVNIYYQVMDEKDGKFRNFTDGREEYIIYEPTDKGKKIYAEDEVNVRRKKLRAV